MIEIAPINSLLCSVIKQPTFQNRFIHVCFESNMPFALQNHLFPSRIDWSIDLFFLLLQNVDDITAPGYRPGDLTNHKFRTLGTQEGVQHSRNEYMVDLRRIQGKNIADFIQMLTSIWEEKKKRKTKM